MPIDRAVVSMDFIHHANAMRGQYEAFFADGGAHGEPHRVWDYFYVPDAYAYLRASSERALGEQVVRGFVDSLQRHVREKYGLNTVTWPYISLYLNGMGQGIHNDACNGTYGYVFSLTRWDRRKFQGGETLVGRLGEFDAIEPRVPRSVASYFDIYPPHFGQLLLFDDRFPHSVPTVMGTMDPLEARVVLHGHIQA
jgi:hypothetical protein